MRDDVVGNRCGGVKGVKLREARRSWERHITKQNGIINF